jgi:ubiquinone/menaquinone biosynthesis C-methylase UbiE
MRWHTSPVIDSSGHSAMMANLFDKLSDSYDEVGVDFFKPIAATLLRAMPPVEAEHWLDVGCGRGAVLFPAAEGIGPHGLAIGIDISEGMIEHARRLAWQSGLRNVECEVDDAQSPSAIKGSFDTISSSLVLFFLADPLAALRNWLPLLKPGGRLGVTTFGPVDPRWEYVDEVFIPHFPSQMIDARTAGKAGPFSTDEGVERLLNDAGFTNIRTQTSTINVRFLNAQQWYDFTWSIGQRMMWLAIPEQLRANVRADAEARLAEFVESDGSITFTQGIRNTLGTRPIS